MKTGIVLVLIVMLAVCSAAKAEPITLSAYLTVAQQFPPPDLPPGINPTGYVTLAFDLDARQLQFSITWSGLSSNATAAAIRPYQFGPVIAGLLRPPGAFGTEGTHSGTISLSSDQIAFLQYGIQNGLLFIDLYTVRNISPGEIAGRFAIVPEPATIFLLTGGLTLISVRHRRQRKRASGACEAENEPVKGL